MALQPNNSNILMTSIKALKDRGFLAEELEEVNAAPIIRFIQDNRIQGALGTKLYESILSEISNDTVSDDNKVLLDSYIIAAIGYFMQAELVIPLSRKLRNMGSVDTYDTNVVKPSLADLTFQMEHYNNRAEFYLNELIKYLRQNTSKYPLYLSADCDDTVGGNSFKSPMYLGLGKRRCGNGCGMGKN